MAPSDLPVPVQFILDAVRRRVEETSLRKVASEVGLSPNGLRGMLAGAPPRASNVKKLVAWYRRPQEHVLRPTSEIVEAALAVLSSELPHDRRDAAEKDLLLCLEKHFLTVRIARPRWLSAVTDPRRI
jgi:hypothetical protein